MFHPAFVSVSVILLETSSNIITNYRIYSVCFSVFNVYLLPFMVNKDVKLPSTLWSDRVRRFEEKFAECDNIFWQNFSLNSIAYIYWNLVNLFQHITVSICGGIYA